MKKLIIEVGSTTTKINKYDGKIIERLEEITILFKKHYQKDGSIRLKDIEVLEKMINAYKKIMLIFTYVERVYFANLPQKKKSIFCKELKIILDSNFT